MGYAFLVVTFLKRGLDSLYFIVGGLRQKRVPASVFSVEEIH